jgi:hypothetical protein
MLCSSLGLEGCKELNIVERGRIDKLVEDSWDRVVGADSDDSGKDDRCDVAEDLVLLLLTSERVFAVKLVPPVTRDA